MNSGTICLILFLFGARKYFSQKLFEHRFHAIVIREKSERMLLLACRDYDSSFFI